MRAFSAEVLMKLHAHMIEQVAAGLVQVFSQGQRAEKMVAQQLKSQRQWGSRDRRFYAEQIYSCVRWWRKLWFCLDLPEVEAPTLPEAKMAWACHWILTGQPWSAKLPIPEVQVAKILERQTFLETAQDQDAIRESIPDWLYARGLRERGERWPSLVRSLNQPAPVDLRVNLNKISREKLLQRLRQQEVLAEVIASVETGITLNERKNLALNESYLQGLFEFQDRGSQRIIPLLPVQPGWRVIDACAGAGGKTLHLASLKLSTEKSRPLQILAMDVHEWKLRELQKRAARHGISGLEIQTLKSDDWQRILQKTSSDLPSEGAADAVILDVPCSGTGVWRRHCDDKWRLRPSDLEKILSLQGQLLRAYSTWVKPGGYLLYATCSIMTSENQGQVEKFLQDQRADGDAQWEPVTELVIDPDQHQGDGFFAALLKRVAT